MGKVARLNVGDMVEKMGLGEDGVGEDGVILNLVNLFSGNRGTGSERLSAPFPRPSSSSQSLNVGAWPTRSPPTLPPVL